MLKDTRRRSLRLALAWLGRVDAKFHQPSEPERQLHVSLQPTLMRASICSSAYHGISSGTPLHAYDADYRACALLGNCSLVLQPASDEPTSGRELM